MSAKHKSKLAPPPPPPALPLLRDTTPLYARTYRFPIQTLLDIRMIGKWKGQNYTEVLAKLVKDCADGIRKRQRRDRGLRSYRP